MLEFLNMGGYAAFVWPSYLLAAVIMAGLWLTSRRALKLREAELKRLEGEAVDRRGRRREEVRSGDA
jgi:heme exporter protein D